MSKRALSPSSHLSTSSSSSPSSRQRRPDLQLLHDLPAALLSTICSFLSVYQVMSMLLSTCRALHGSVTADCLLQSRLVLSSCSLPSLLAASSSTRALISRMRSLTVLYSCEQKDDDPQYEMLPLQELRSPVDASRFLFSSLTSLHFIFAEKYMRPQRGLNCLLGAMQLLEADAGCFSSLRHLVVHDTGCLVDEEALELPVASLAGMRP
jgi:hypothetical protein